MQATQDDLEKIVNPIRIWIGSEVKTRIPCKVLQHSIIKSTSHCVEFHVQEGESWVQRPGLGVGTGFSLQRWQIPETFQYKSKCIYLDADQLVLSDIQKLWDIDSEFLPKRSSIYCTFQPDKWFPQGAPNTSVMLIDCQLAKDHWWSFDKVVAYLKDDKDRKRYSEIMHGLHLKVAPIQIPSHWNHLNVVDKTTNLIHYTTEHEQPWYNPSHPHKDLWRNALLDSISAGVVTKEEVIEAIAKYRPHGKAGRGEGMHPYWSKFVK